MTDRFDPTDEELATVLTKATEVVRSMGVSEDDVEESAQRTAYKLWGKWTDPGVERARAAGPGQWKSFIATTARRTYLDLVRARRRRVDRDNRWAGGVETGRPARPGTVLDSGPSNPADIEELLVRSALVHVLKTFSPRRRVVAYLIVVERWSVADVAEYLGISSAAVSRHKAKALVALRQQFADVDDEPAEG